MRVKFGNNDLEEIRERYIVLELDTIYHSDPPHKITCYGIIGADEISVEDLPMTEQMSNLHLNLMINYKMQNWEFCEQVIDHLLKFWPVGYDEFYLELLDRITNFKENPPGKDWTSVIDQPDK